jgi:hypothetical protein
MVHSGAWGKLIHEKNQKSKISWHCPFKSTDLSLKVPISEHKLKEAEWVITVSQTNLQYVAKHIHTDKHPRSATLHIGDYFDGQT